MNAQPLNALAKSMKLVRLPEVMKLTGLARPTIYRAIQKGQFPAPVKLGRASAWPEHEVHEWIEARMGERNSAA